MTERRLEDRPVKRSISFVIRHPGQPNRVLIVRRPDDDAELPGVWGLPAGSLRPDERWEDTVRRAGRDKLGVELDVGRMLREGTVERRDYVLRMRLFEAHITDGEPHVPQRKSHPGGSPHRRHPHPGVTQYRQWRWGTAEELRPAAGKGSLCSRLFLEAELR